MVEKNYRLVDKYALLLSSFYVAELIFWFYIKDAMLSDAITRQERSLLSMTKYVFSFFLSLITVWSLYTDKSKLQVETRYVFLATLLYRPIGVCAFLLYVLYENKKSAVESPVQ
jgi:hypothetical protein